MDKATIAKNFSRHAHTYDMHSHVQKRMACELLGMTGDKPVNKILEIGSGTGNYTLLLQEKFINSEIKAVDISDRMIEVAAGKINGGKGIKFVLDDAERISLNEEFDIVTSNACFQWFGDLKSALAKYKNLLKDGGVILFSTFGPDTFKELSESLKYVFKGVAINSGNFIGRDNLKSVLDKNFSGVEVKETVYTESFSCLKEFLNRIKRSGIRGGAEASKVFFTPQLMKKLEEVYLDKFGQIKATYQAFFCLGTK